MRREWPTLALWARALDGQAAAEVIPVDIHEALALSPWSQDQYIQPLGHLAVETSKFLGLLLR